MRKSEPDAAETAAQEAATPAAQLASWKTVVHVDWREQVEKQASAGDVASTSHPATAAAERLAVIPAPVTPAVERMLQVTHSTILGATFAHCACWSRNCMQGVRHPCQHCAQTVHSLSYAY